MSETEKWKKIAIDRNKSFGERMNARQSLYDIGTREAMLALLDVANDAPSELDRIDAQYKATEIRQRLREEKKI